MSFFYKTRSRTECYSFYQSEFLNNQAKEDKS